MSDQIMKYCSQGPGPAAAFFNAGFAESELKRREWIADLRSRGISASHPDDGWVDREENIIRPSYLDFDDGVKVGSIIALGDYDKCRVVRVIEIVPPLIFVGAPQWKFELIIKEMPKRTD